MDEEEYLDKFIFVGLANLNDGFDSKSIKYFSPKDFEIVLSRVQKYGIGITGIEPWKNGEFYGVAVYEDYTENPTDSKWYKDIFDQCLKSGIELQYSASYYIPEKLLK